MAKTTQLRPILFAMLILNILLILQLWPSHQVLKPKDVAPFNPDIPDEHGLGPIAMVGSDTVYRDIYTWVDYLRDLARTHSINEVRQNIQQCLRGSAATWWIVELTVEDRRKLRNAHLERWFPLLIERFKIQRSVALTKLTSSSYTWGDLDRSPRMWIHEMLRYTKAAGLESTYMGLSIIWSRFAANLRKDIPMPMPTTKLVDFLEQVDTLYPAWREQEHGKDDFPPMVDTLNDGTPRYKLDVSKLRPFYDSTVNDRRSYAWRPDVFGILVGLTQRLRQAITNVLVVYRRLQGQIHTRFHHLLLHFGLKPRFIDRLNFVVNTLSDKFFGPRRYHPSETSRPSTRHAW